MAEVSSRISEQFSAPVSENVSSNQYSNQDYTKIPASEVSVPNDKSTENINNAENVIKNLSDNEKLTGISEEHSEFSIQELYRFALKFYKDKGDKAVHFTYEVRCNLVALTQQVNHGPFNQASFSPLGVLDVVGRDRRLAWQSLGTIAKEEAMEQFVGRLHQLTPTFMPYLEALRADHLEKERLLQEEEVKKKEEEVQRTQEFEDEQKEHDERKKQEETKRKIQEALNQQTFAQFKTYAEQQFPNNPEEQGVLIKQLQEQHYQQYMHQVYQQQLLVQQQTQHQHLQNTSESPDVENLNSLSNISLEEDENITRSDDALLDGDRATEDEIQTEDEDELNKRIVPASMWTRRDLKAFKDSIRQEGRDSIIKVGHGETVTVRVPTHEEGSCIFWEFATDSYDIGFGVFFEWTNDVSNIVSVHITESDDDEEEEDDGESDDIERLASSLRSEVERPAQSVIIPVYRRDCHEEVYAGSHAYPGTGVYLLKFDNSYSLWRNKVLYYRVYYTR